jgi:hypothetical protein
MTRATFTSTPAIPAVANLLRQLDRLRLADAPLLAAVRAKAKPSTAQSPGARPTSRHLLPALGRDASAVGLLFRRRGFIRVHQLIYERP